MLNDELARWGDIFNDACKNAMILLKPDQFTFFVKKLVIHFQYGICFFVHQPFVKIINGQAKLFCQFNLTKVCASDLF